MSLEQKLFNHSFIIGWYDGYVENHNGDFARENAGYNEGYRYYHCYDTDRTGEGDCTPYHALANYLFMCEVER